MQVLVIRSTYTRATTAPSPFNLLCVLIKGSSSSRPLHPPAIPTTEIGWKISYKKSRRQPRTVLRPPAGGKTSLITQAPPCGATSVAHLPEQPRQSLLHTPLAPAPLDRPNIEQGVDGPDRRRRSDRPDKARSPERFDSDMDGRNRVARADSNRDPGAEMGSDTAAVATASTRH